jgi:hypothetical protein
MPKLDLEAIEQVNRTTYPPPFAAAMAGRFVRRLAPAGDLTDFGVSQVTLKPGGISSQRHWHEEEDEFVVMLAGEAVLIENEGETIMRPGDLRQLSQGGGERAPSREPQHGGLRLHRCGTDAGGRMPLFRHRPAPARRRHAVRPQGWFGILKGRN